MDTVPAGEKPGIIWTNSRIINTDDLPKEKFVQWYENIHLIDVRSTGAVSDASRWEAQDPNCDAFHLALYYAPNVDGLLDRMKSVPHHHESIPGSHDIFDHAFFDTRFYRWIQTYQREGPHTDTPSFCISSEMSPSDVEDFNEWYRHEHLKDGSRVRGWRRTERYELITALGKQDAPRFLTLFFLEGDTLSMEDLAKGTNSEWTQKIVASMQQLRVVAFKKGVSSW